MKTFLLLVTLVSSSAIAETHHNQNIDGKMFPCHGGYAHMQNGKDIHKYDTLFNGTCFFTGTKLSIKFKNGLVELDTRNTVAQNSYELNGQQNEEGIYIQWHVQLDYKDNNFSF